jgi:hypothetical protein
MRKENYMVTFGSFKQLFAPGNTKPKHYKMDAEIRCWLTVSKKGERSVKRFGMRARLALPTIAVRRKCSANWGRAGKVTAQFRSDHRRKAERDLQSRPLCKARIDHRGMSLFTASGR